MGKNEQKKKYKYVYVLYGIFLETLIGGNYFEHIHIQLHL